MEGGDCHPMSYGEWPPGESMRGIDGEERIGNVIEGVVGEALDEDETLSVLRLEKYPPSSDRRLARAFLESGLKRVILLYLLDDLIVSLEPSKTGRERSYLFFAERPVRPGKYVFTILVQTLPCSSTALSRRSSWMQVSTSTGGCRGLRDVHLRESKWSYQ
jgi:hypothetical protein